jgi:putative transcriptional regulator
MTRFSLDDVANAKPTDLSKLRATTDDDIARQIAADPDAAPDLSDADPADFVQRDNAVDVRTLRLAMGLTQEQFAHDFGVNIRTLRDWENHRREPEGPAQTLLKVIARRPDAVRAALHAGLS